MTGAPGPDTGGPLMFVRYAYPPNALGYFGPADFAAFREYAVAGVVDRGLVQLAQAFVGAWPYLELIAAVQVAGSMGRCTSSTGPDPRSGSIRRTIGSPSGQPDR